MSQLFFLWYEEIRTQYLHLCVNHREALNHCLLLLLDMFPVAAGIAERVGGAAALFKVIVSSFPDFLSVTLSSFLTSVILHNHCVFSFK